MKDGISVLDNFCGEQFYSIFFIWRMERMVSNMLVDNLSEGHGRAYDF